MEAIVATVIEYLELLVPSAIALLLVVIGLGLARKLLETASGAGAESHFRNELTMLLLSGLGLLVIVLALPLSDATRAQLLNLAGIVLSAGIALASTTFIGNVMAGLMLRAVRNFRTGDFVRVEGHFGRVTERGLLHTEIQTEDRDLTTLPNLYLVTHPVKVIRSSGTIVTATVSLGYDVDRARVERLLLQAARDAGLTDPFVHVTGLGDFSVSYRFAGFLEDVGQILSTRSHLNACGLDALHAGGVEIVSPTFMNTRAFDPTDRFVSNERRGPDPLARTTTAEDIAFDKADQAEQLERLRQIDGSVSEKVKELEHRIAKTSGDQKAALEKSRESLTRRHDRLAQTIEAWDSKS